MKVAIIIDTWFPCIGGGQVNAWEISKRIASPNLQIDIVTRNSGNDLLKKPPYLNVYKLGPVSKPDNTYSKLYFLVNSFFFILGRDYDLIHVHPFLPALVAKVLSILKSIPLIITVHGTRLFENGRKTPSIVLERFILTQIKYNLQISVTKAFLKIANQNQKISVIPNGIDVKKFANKKVSKFPIPTVLWVGRFDRVKKVEDLILAAKIVAKTIKNFQVMLVGYGYEEMNLKKLVHDLKLKNVKFLGLKTGSELTNIYNKAHVFVMPSASEGQPLTIMEAQAASLPVVATNVGGIGELVTHRQTGLLVPSHNPNQLAKSLLYVLKNKNSFGENGFEKIKKFNDWDTIAQKTKNIYLSLVKT